MSKQKKLNAAKTKCRTWTGCFLSWETPQEEARWKRLRPVDNALLDAEDRIHDALVHTNRMVSSQAKRHADRARRKIDKAIQKLTRAQRLIDAFEAAPPKRKKRAVR